jgi:hypothetical protein
MNIISTAEMGRFEALLHALRTELGGVVAERVIDPDSLRLPVGVAGARALSGQHIEPTSDDYGSLEDISRIAFLSFLDGSWYGGMCLADAKVRRWNCSGTGHSQAVKRPRSGPFRRDRQLDIDAGSGARASLLLSFQFLRRRLQAG